MPALDLRRARRKSVQLRSVDASSRSRLTLVCSASGSMSASEPGRDWVNCGGATIRKEGQRSSAPHEEDQGNQRTFFGA